MKKAFLTEVFTLADLIAVGTNIKIFGFTAFGVVMCALWFFLMPSIYFEEE